MYFIQQRRRDVQNWLANSRWQWVLWVERIYRDNGPQNSNHRTQFMKRMIDFADKNNLEIVLVYYPPYYSKYNPIERCWGILENHWSATLLNTIETTLEWAKTMTWKGMSPVIKLVKIVYQKGVRMTKKAFNALANRIDRDASLPKYYLTIKP